MRIMSSGGRLAELEQSAGLLVREVERLTRENKDLAKLKQENIRLQERNIQLAAELSALTAERERRDGREEGEEREGYSDVSTGGCPGDSYPAVAASLDDIESDVNTDGEEVEQEVVETQKQEPDYLLQKVRKGGTRMDQIKRQLVVQRGAIVAALKVLAQSRSASTGSLTSTEGEEEEEEEEGEKDRTLVSMTTTDSRSECKMCPMCEAMFPLHSEEEFEQHVMDHFSYDSDPDTLQYYPHHQPDIDAEIQTEHL